tara:strand:- start:401 stop:604 length:204 start_codon:yes stop_codon:yes gene_type:complete
MTSHIFESGQIEEFFRQTINAIIEVCNARGDSSTLAQIVTKLETLRAGLESENNPADLFPGGEHDGG